MFASIRLRILAAFMAGMLVMLAAIGVLVVQVEGVSRSQSLITSGYLPLAKSVARLTTWQARIDNDVRRLLTDEARPGIGQRSPTEIFSEKLKEDVQTARTLTHRIQGKTHTTAQAAGLNKILVKLGRIDSLFQDYRDEVGRIIQAVEAGDAAPDQIDGARLLDLSNALGDEIQTLSQEIDARIANLTAEAEAAQLRATAIAGGLSALAFVFASILLGLVFYALRPIGRLTDQVQRLALGDYSGRVEVRGADEISGLAAEFNKMVLALKARDEALVERANELNTLSGYLASVLDSLQEGLFVLEDGLITLTNPAATEIWHATEGRPAPAALAPLLTPGWHEVRGPNNSLHEMRVTAFGENGYVVSTADVTAATHAKEHLARSERLALVGQMLAQITHEVRNPLNALSLNAEMLADELAQYDPQKHTEGWEILGTIASEIDRLTAVTGHYLQLARRPKAKLESHNLESVVSDVQRLLDAELESKGVQLHTTFAPLPAVQIDGNQLRQALLNIVRNAVEAGADDLVLTVDRVDDNVEIVLTDNGSGMTLKDIERATDPFYSTKASGTGLGLAITRQILEDHDGSIRVTSTPGQGTVISLRFPLGRAAA